MGQKVDYSFGKTPEVEITARAGTSVVFGGRPSQKSFITKVKLGKAKKQNRPLPQWFRLKTDTKIRWNAKRRNWRHTKLNI
ncbi:hypothetical protein G6F56_001268 [Rhizopus delemar]|nr:hypothetical protein G6F56_001268 [Rhizopus delemar]